MSFYTALTGLNGSSADISATSNNIANVALPALSEAGSNSVTSSQHRRCRMPRHRLVLVQS